VVIALLEKALAKSAGTTVLLDGFPRSMENAMAFDSLFGPGEFLMFFDCPDEEMKRRIVERGRVKNYEVSPLIFRLLVE
jgi:UMP-CMP kinase